MKRLFVFSILLSFGIPQSQALPLVSPGNMSGGISVAGDFNGDGFLDLAIVNPGFSTVTILPGNGDGTFGNKCKNNIQSYAVGKTPRAVAVGDFNEDGILDLVVANEGNNTFSVLLGVGDGTFVLAYSYAAGAKPEAIAVADFNGDGHKDVAVLSAGTNVSILLGNGDGTFNPQVTYPVGNGHQAGDLALADFNTDGFQDLAIVNGSDSTVSVLSGVGDGTFNPQVTYPVGDGTSTTGGITTGYINSDSKLDVVVVNSNDSTVSVLQGIGDGTFLPQIAFGVLDGSGGSSQSPGIAVADFNLDGKFDIAASNPDVGSVSVLISKGSAVFNTQIPYPAGVNLMPNSLVLGDFNGDGYLDFVVVSNSQSVSTLLGRGDGTFRHLDANPCCQQCPCGPIIVVNPNPTPKPTTPAEPAPSTPRL